MESIRRPDGVHQALNAVSTWRQHEFRLALKMESAWRQDKGHHLELSALFTRRESDEEGKNFDGANHFSQR